MFPLATGVLWSDEIVSVEGEIARVSAGANQGVKIGTTGYVFTVEEVADERVEVRHALFAVTSVGDDWCRVTLQKVVGPVLAGQKVRFDRLIAEREIEAAAGSSGDDAPLPPSSRKEEEAATLLGQANRLLDVGDREGARAYFEQFISLFPEDPSADFARRMILRLAMPESGEMPRDGGEVMVAEELPEPPRRRSLEERETLVGANESETSRLVFVLGQRKNSHPWCAIAIGATECCILNFEVTQTSTGRPLGPYCSCETKAGEQKIDVTCSDNASWPRRSDSVSLQLLPGEVRGVALDTKRNFAVFHLLGLRELSKEELRKLLEYRHAPAEILKLAN